MRMNRIVTVGVLALSLSLSSVARPRVGETCTSEFPVPPPLIQTGLGSTLDELVHSAYPIQWRTKQVVRENWMINYGTSSATDKKNKIITVISGQSAPYTTSHFAHEVGHATSSFSENLTSRAAYVRSRCTDEGFALGVNIVARRTIKQCAGVDVGVVSADVPYFTEWHESMAANPPILYGDFGYAFCERNTESISGKNYLDYYGDWYDAHYVAPPPDSRGFDSGPFFDRIESLANLATEGPKALRNYWPGGESLVQSQTHSNSYAGGGAHLVEGISVIESEIRVSRDDASHLVLATMKIDAPCISLETMRARYPSVIMTDAPRTASPDAYAAWSIFGPWGEIAFGFSYANPKCISRVTLIPDAFPPALSL